MPVWSLIIIYIITYLAVGYIIARRFTKASTKKPLYTPPPFGTGVLFLFWLPIVLLIIVVLVVILMGNLVITTTKGSGRKSDKRVG